MMTGLRTALGERLGVAVPLVQAPVGSAAGPELAAAVSDAGGLGMLALTWSGPGQAGDRICEVRRRTRRPFGVNLVLDFPVDDTLAVCLEEAVPVVSTFWGDPASVSRRIRDAGALHMHTVGSVAEAVYSVGCGVDVIVAQGWEAGGHVRGTTTTMVLVPAVVDAVGSVPVMAAGGISDGRGVAAALALGAQGVWLGTRFLATTGGPDACGVPAITSSPPTPRTPSTPAASTAAGPTRRTAPCATRTLRALGSPPDRPRRRSARAKHDVVAVDAARPTPSPVRGSDPAAGDDRRGADMALYAGQSVGLLHDVRPAGHLVDDITAQAIEVIERLRRTTRPAEVRDITMNYLPRTDGQADHAAAVLFDVDGVLVDSYAAYRLIRVAAGPGIVPWTLPIVWLHTHGRRPVDTIAVVASMRDAEAEYRLVRDFMADEGDAFPADPTPPPY